MKRHWLALIAAGLTCAAAAGIVIAQETAKSSAAAGPAKGAAVTVTATSATASATARPADDAAIRAASQAFAQAFEKGDAKVIASFWTEEGEYIDEGGEPVHGRAALEKAYATFFTDRPDLKVEDKCTGVRFLGKDAAVEEGTFTVTAKGNPPNASRYSAMYVRQEGRWLIALLKEWGKEDAEVSLDDLAWLIGSWKSDSADVEASTKYEWVENKKFIRCAYTVVNKKDASASMSGTQMIGVDPTGGAIHAWTFDSTGGTGQSRWSNDGRRWVIDSTGTMADGTETTAQNYMTRKGTDEFTWRSVERTDGDAKLPDVGPVTVKRVK